ncbi:MAG TPA: hypothetical protein VID70_08600 [Solirubrobacteraceae bacterium]
MPQRARNGKLSIPMPFEDAIRAALRVKPETTPASKPDKAPRKARKAAPRPTRHGTAP